MTCRARRQGDGMWLCLVCDKSWDRTEEKPECEPFTRMIEDLDRNHDASKRRSELSKKGLRSFKPVS